MLNLASEDDDDGNAASGKGNAPAKAETTRQATQKAPKASTPTKAKEKAPALPNGNEITAMREAAKAAGVVGAKEAFELISIWCGREITGFAGMKPEDIANCTAKFQQMKDDAK